MNNKIKQKLHNQRGVTVLMALLFLLLCAMVGSVVVSSASANADKTSGRKEMQAQYLALASAIRFLEGTIDGKSCVGIESEARYACKGRDIVGPAHADEPKWTQPMKMTDADGKLQTYLQNLADDFFKHNTEFFTTVYYPPTMPVSFAIEGEGMEKVEVSLQMSRNYGMTFSITVPGSAYQAILSFDAQVTKEESTQALSCIHNVVVTNVDGSSTTVPTTFTNKTYHHTTTVVWTKKSLTKGAVAS